MMQNDCQKDRLMDSKIGQPTAGRGVMGSMSQGFKELLQNSREVGRVEAMKRTAIDQLIRKLAVACQVKQRQSLANLRDT